MTCPNCNSQYNDNLAACPFCGAQSAYAPVAPQQTYAQPQQTYAQPQQTYAQPQQTYAQPQQTAFPEAQQAPYQAPQGAFVAPPAPAKKKKKSGLISIIIIAIFAICGIIGYVGENKEQTHTFVMEEAEDGFTITYEYELVHKGDDVNKIICTQITEFDEGMDEDIIAEEYEAYVEEQRDTYDDYDFVTYEVEIDGRIVTETITLNDASDNVSGLIDLGFMDSYADSVSYEKTKDNLEDDGFELVED